MFNNNFHTHTRYCDGKNTPEEMVLSAIELGFDSLGFSGHAYTDIDLSYCMTPENTKEYIAEINALKKKYAGRINIYCGTELDFYSPDLGYDYDYTIGSVHYLYAGGEYTPVDSSAKIQLEATEKYFGGDYMSYAEKYFETVSQVAEKLKPDIIGHFDLVSKFNEDDCMFDSQNPRYVRAWQEAALKLIGAGIPFEINTGAIARGARKTPYPSLEIAQFINDNGGFFIVTSDCHNRDFLDCAFDYVKEKYSRFNLVDFEPGKYNKK
ncbi:MAG: histidinol-phosphatase [Clostridia bacterium]|nr:histidinol-phosphatase [Clostridia bacterium]